jgi:DNA-binding beta-propeller fold protein YncE
LWQYSFNAAYTQRMVVMTSIKFTAKQAGFYLLIAVCFLLVTVFTGSVYAQPEVKFEFKSTFGKKSFYDRGPNRQINSIPPEGFNSPTGVAFQSADRLIVADRGNSKLQSCDDRGNCFWIGADGDGFTRNMPGTFDLPHGVSVALDGSMNIADEDNHLLQVCEPNGSCKAKGVTTSARAECSSSLGKWCLPQDTEVDSLGRIYGLDTGNNRIQILRAGDLFVLDVFMRPGSAPGQINNARGIAIDQNDRIIIADTGNNRIQICDVDENCTTFGSQGSAVGQFNAPVGVDVDAPGRIWVADTDNHRIQVCDYEGNCVAFGEFGTGEGQFDQPHDVAVHSSGRVAVVDTNNHRIQLFSTEASFQMNPGLNDAWFDPETDGQGFFITVFPELGFVLLAWFTYDTELPPADASANLGDAGHRWLTAVGAINGNQAALEIEIASGGLFDQATDITRVSDGTINLSFESCEKGLIEYDIPSIGQQGTVPIQRVAKDNIALCESL